MDDSWENKSPIFLVRIFCFILFRARCLSSIIKSFFKEWIGTSWNFELESSSGINQFKSRYLCYKKRFCEKPRKAQFSWKGWKWRLRVRFKFETISAHKIKRCEMVWRKKGRDSFLLIKIVLENFFLDKRSKSRQTQYPIKYNCLWVFRTSKETQVLEKESIRFEKKINGAPEWSSSLKI